MDKYTTFEELFNNHHPYQFLPLHQYASKEKAMEYYYARKKYRELELECGVVCFTFDCAVPQRKEYYLETLIENE